MNRLQSQLLLALVSLFVAVCSLSRPAAALESADVFLQQSASAARTQVRLATVALQNASDTRVRELAAVILNDQSQLLGDIRETAGRTGTDIERGVSTEQLNNLNALTVLSGAGFDRAYLSFLELALLVEARRYAEQAAEGRNRRVRNLADDSAALIEQDLALVRTLQSALVPVTDVDGTSTAIPVSSGGGSGGVYVCPNGQVGTSGVGVSTSTGAGTSTIVTTDSTLLPVTEIDSLVDGTSGGEQIVIPQLPPLGTSSGSFSPTVPTSLVPLTAPSGTVIGPSGDVVNTVPGGILSDPTLTGIETDFHPGGILSHDLVQR